MKASVSEGKWTNSRTCWQMASPGNWMHLQYQSRLQARKALSKDGKVFGDSIMVGVKPCIDKVSTCGYLSVYLSLCCLIGCSLQMCLRFDRSSSDVCLFQSVMDGCEAASSPLSSSFSSSVLPSTPRSAIRPLGATYRSSCSDFQVTSDLHFNPDLLFIC